jgi:hypothetical protein
MELHVRGQVYGFYVSPSPTPEEEQQLWDAVEAINLHNDEDETISLKVDRVPLPPTSGEHQFKYLELSCDLVQMVTVWIGTPLGVGTTVKVVDKLLEVTFPLFETSILSTGLSSGP